MLFGLESGSQRILDELNKGVTVEEIVDSCGKAKRLVDGGYADTLQSTLLIPYPGSRLYGMALEKGWGLAGSMETERAVHEGWIKVLGVMDNWRAREMAVALRIQLANAETVQLAREVKADILLADEMEVRELAAEFSLEVVGCLGLLVEAVRRELISVEEARRDAKRLMDEGYRISEEVLRRFYTILESEGSERR